jgi:hypothetical protein
MEKHCPRHWGSTSSYRKFTGDKMRPFFSIYTKYPDGSFTSAMHVWAVALSPNSMPSSDQLPIAIIYTPTEDIRIENKNPSSSGGSKLRESSATMMSVVVSWGCISSERIIPGFIGINGIGINGIVIIGNI